MKIRELVTLFVTGIIVINMSVVQATIITCPQAEEMKFKSMAHSYNHAFYQDGGLWVILYLEQDPVRKFALGPYQSSTFNEAIDQAKIDIKNVEGPTSSTALEFTVAEEGGNFVAYQCNYIVNGSNNIHGYWVELAFHDEPIPTNVSQP